MTSINLEEALANSKRLMKNDYSLIFRKYSMSYFTTTEFIADYLDNEHFNRGRGLTVLASGDHVFGLVEKGIKEIDAFDINRLAYYIYHFKLAMLKKLPYDKFLKVCYNFTYWTYRDEVIEVLNNLKDNMPEDVYEYFRRIFEWEEKEAGSIDYLFYEPTYGTLEKANSYLHSEENYLLCRKKVIDTKVNLFFGDARSIPEIVDGTYDIILLSNIADYFGRIGVPLRLEKFRDYINSYYDLLNKDGLIINYLFGTKCKHLITDSLITIEDLGRDNVMLCTSDILSNQGYYRVRK